MAQNGTSGEKPTVKADLSRIEAALKAARRVAATMRRGGLQELWDECTSALEALERAREAWKERPVQMAMFRDGEMTRGGSSDARDGSGE